ncbi:hypothetical protein [Runella sp.]|uniref:hypothetical protein n=1 Tax=Runella sp. TaxID=1960881 RepID=UPI003D0C7DF3
MTTKYGRIEIANTESFSCHLSGFGISPYLQEKLLYLAQEGTYLEASQTGESLLNLKISPVQIYRLANHYGQYIEAPLNDTLIDKEPPVKQQKIAA